MHDVDPEIEIHDQLVWEEKLGCYKGYERVEFHKQIMVAAAQYTREHLQDHAEESTLIQSQTLTTISRIVWTQ